MGLVGDPSFIFSSIESEEEMIDEKKFHEYDDTGTGFIHDDIIEWMYNKPQIKVTFDKHLNDDGIKVLSVEIGVIVKYDNDPVTVEKHFEYIPSNQKLLSTLKRMYSSVWC